MSSISSVRSTFHPVSILFFTAILFAVSCLVGVVGAGAGVIDNTFGRNGWQQLPRYEIEPGFKPAGVTAVPGGFRAFGAMNEDLAIFAFNEDGSLDTSFHGTGWHLLDLVAGNGADIDRPTQVLPHGKDGTVVAGSIPVAGSYTYRDRLTVSRITDTGRLDRSFGKRGSTLVSSVQPPIGLAASRNGGFFTLSAVEPTSGIPGFRPRRPGSIKLLRFRSNGKLDRGFGRNGVYTRSVARGSRPIGVAAAPGGGAFVLATDEHDRGRDGGSRSSLIRLDARGNPVRTFGKNGVAARIDHAFMPAALLPLGDGKVLVFGRASGDDRSVLLRYLPDGTLDPTFGDQGLSRVRKAAIGSRPRMVALPGGGFALGGSTGISLFASDGEMVQTQKVSGAKFGSGPGQSVITVRHSKRQPVLGRLGPDGPDAAFTTNAEPPKTLAFRVSREFRGFARTRGGLVVASDALNAEERSRIGVRKFLENGTPAQSFGDGQAVLTESPLESEVTLMGTASGGARLVGGKQDSKPLLVTNIGPSGGMRETRLETMEPEQFTRAIPEPGGGFTALGTTTPTKPRRTPPGFYVARSRADGTPDPRFGGDGVVLKRVRKTAIYPLGLVRDSKGRIVVAGNANCSKRCGNEKETYQARLVAARFLPNGRPDRSFGRGGVVSHRIAWNTQVTQLSVLGDGRLLFQGADSPCPGSCENEKSLLALREDGEKDRRFGRAGRLDLKLGRYFDVRGIFPAGRHGVDLAADIEPCGQEAAIGVIRLTRSGRLDRRFGGGDGAIKAIPAGGHAAYIESAVRQGPGSMTMAAHLETPGRYGGIERATGLTRLKLKTKDGKTNLRPCRR